MTQRQRIILAIAVVVSVLLHAAVLSSVLGVRLGSNRHELFASEETTKQIELIPVYRATHDLIEDDAGGSGDEAIGTDTPGAKPTVVKAQQVERAAERVLAGVKPGAVLRAEPATPATPNPRLAETIKTGPVGTPAAPPPPLPLDTSRLLAMSEPKLELPTYHGPTDAVKVPGATATAVDPRAHIDLTHLQDLGGASSGPIGPSADATVLGEIGGVRGGVPGGAAGGVVGGSVGRTVGAKPPAVEVPDVSGAVKLPGEGRREPLHLDHDFDYTMRAFRGPLKRPGFFGLGGEADPNEPGWFEVTITPRRSLHRLKALHKDVIYLVDVSGSIGRWIGPVKEGVIAALDSLNAGDRFNIVLFKDTVSILANTGLLEPTAGNFEAARRFMKTAASSGYTDINQALARFIVRQMPPDRVYQIVLISDGQPTRGEIDAAQIINVITRENDLVAGIYCVGVGDRVNKKLLELLAYRNKGDVVYPKDVTKAVTAIRDLSSRLRYPVVKDAVIDTAGVDGDSIYPRMPRDVYQGEPVRFYGRFTPGDTKLWVRVSGTSADVRADFLFNLDFAHAGPGDEAIAHAWAVWKMHHLSSEVIRRGDSPELREQLDTLRKRYGVDVGY